MPAPDDSRRGAVPREPSCHACPHPHHILPCDFGTCSCASDYAPGIDTALGG